MQEFFLERALKLEPENFATHYNLGLLYKSFKKGRGVH